MNSAIGKAQLRLVLYSFALTDPLDEHVSFTNDQIDAITKNIYGTDRFVSSLQA